jgi:hypothetical protein
MGDIGNLIWRIFGRFIGPTDEPPAYTAAATHARPAPAE